MKERIKSMLYSWKVGLPQEPKINEAYLMLKREGLCACVLTQVHSDWYNLVFNIALILLWTGL